MLPIFGKFQRFPIHIPSTPSKNVVSMLNKVTFIQYVKPSLKWYPFVCKKCIKYNWIQKRLSNEPMCYDDILIGDGSPGAGGTYTITKLYLCHNDDFLNVSREVRNIVSSFIFGTNYSILVLVTSSSLISFSYCSCYLSVTPFHFLIFQFLTSNWTSFRPYSCIIKHTSLNNVLMNGIV